MSAATREAVLSLIVDDWGGMHPGAWRYPDAPADPAMDYVRILEMAKTAERGKFHALFLADSLNLGINQDIDLVATTSNVSRFEPFTLLAALSQATSHIGLALTASTTYSEPYNIARMFASLDHLSRGRAAWNVVTTNADAAPNFNDFVLDRGIRYERAAEFVDVVTGLWDSLDDGAMIRDKQSGRFFSPEKLHTLNHRGTHFQVAGPLNISRPPQGWPVIAQAGSSPAGIAFASRVAEVFFVYGQDLEPAQALYAEVKAKVAEAGRNPDHAKVLPSLSIVLGETTADAERKLSRLDDLADIRLGIERLGNLIGHDVSSYELDAPVPDIPSSEHASKTMHDYYLRIARERSLTLRELAHVAVRFDAVAMSPEQVVEHIEERIEKNAADGFNVSFADASGSLDLFVDSVVPELQRRGLFHTDYEGTTLRESLGLPRPVPKGR